MPFTQTERATQYPCPESIHIGKWLIINKILTVYDVKKETYLLENDSN
jgi:hypothetical protein